MPERSSASSKTVCRRASGGCRRNPLRQHCFLNGLLREPTSRARYARAARSEHWSHQQPRSATAWNVRSLSAAASFGAKSIKVAVRAATALRRRGMASSGHASSQNSLRPVRPNPSLNRTLRGRPAWPGRRHSLHCRQPGQASLPLRAG